MLPGMLGSALTAHVGVLFRQEEFSKLIGKMQAVLSAHTAATPLNVIVGCFFMAVSHLALGQQNETAVLVERAIDTALQDGLVYPVAAYSWLLQGLPDQIMKDKYPQHFDSYMTVKEQFGSGWEKLNNAMLQDGLPEDLTEREYEVARLAADGCRNSEIAERLFVSESTVRTHLRTVFQKLEIDRRSRLAEKLK
jgi:LuxR family transcriptional regulator, maltose regulon positive regulatory protein